MADSSITRADVLRSFVYGALAVGIPGAAVAQSQVGPAAAEITIEDLRGYARVVGLTFTDEELTAALRSVRGNPRSFAGLRDAANDYELVPPTVFRARGAKQVRSSRVRVLPARVSTIRPAKDEDIAFLTVVELGHLLRIRQITSTELTKLYLERLRKYGPKLICLVALTEELALREATKADEEIAAGQWRGPLHGIPYGIKDLFAVKGYPTQWGTEAFRGQVVDKDAAVVEKMREAGAVLVAKLSLGALAMNDNWFMGRTKNPWKPDEGSSGSSAGSAAAVAAGLVPFAIGTETSGSIMSPCYRCRVTGLRPTFGSISRYGAMALSWTMDKPGPIARTAEDAALVLAALLGQDERDISTLDRQFEYRSPRDLKGMKVGVLSKQDTEPAKMLASFGAELAEFKAPPAPPGLDLILEVESASMFDAITRDGRLNLVKENQWPQYFRAARFVPAVEYALAERARSKLMDLYDEAFSPFDLVLAPAHAAPMIYNSNLTGHPQIHVPFRPDDKGGYTSFSVFAKPFEEAKMIAAAHLVQKQTGFYRLRPDLSKL